MHRVIRLLSGVCLFLIPVSSSAQNPPCKWSDTETTQTTVQCPAVITTNGSGAELQITDTTGPAEATITGSSTAGGTGLRIGGDRHWKIGATVANSGSGMFAIADFSVTPAKARFVIDPAGNVGINTGIDTLFPWGGLHLSGPGQSVANPVIHSGSTAVNGSTLFLHDTGTSVGNGGMVAFGASTGQFAAIKGFLTDSSNHSLGHLIFATRDASANTTLTERMRIARYGTVGIGTSTPSISARLHVAGAALSWVQFRDTTVTEGYGSGVAMEMTGNSTILMPNLQIGHLTQPVIQSSGAAGVAPLYLNLYSNNDVIIGSSGHNRGLRVEGTGPSSFAGSVTVTGDISVTGNIAAKYQDLAEWVPSVKKLHAGTVVVLDAERSNHVLPSSREYDTGVAGVVSGQPGIALGEAGDSKALIATTGRVRVRVDASRHPIAIGDLLVTSGRPGMAMKSVPLDFQGVAIHRPGTVVGKALEPLASGEGEILVLLSLQ